MTFTHRAAACACGILMLTHAAGAGLFEIQNIALADWDEAAPPYPAMPARTALSADPEARVWKQLVVSYSAAADTLRAALVVDMLCQMHDGTRAVLRGTHRDEGLHESGVPRYVRFFLSPEAGRAIKKVIAVAVSVNRDGLEQAYRVWPDQATNIKFERYPLREGVLLGALAAPWAHLTTDPTGALIVSPSNAPSDTAEGPPASFRKLTELLEQEGGAK